jgi:hypothetical protein
MLAYVRRSRRRSSILLILLLECDFTTDVYTDTMEAYGGAEDI